MDREPEELQFLGLVGICQEASKILLSWRRLFSQIALALVLPLSVLFLAHIYVAHLLFSKIDRSEAALDVATPGSPSESAILSRLSAEWSAFLLFKAAYLLVLSLLSTSAVVYSVASIYTAKDLSFTKVLAVVPKVWRRLMITFLWAFLLLLACNTAVLLLAVSAVSAVIFPTAPIIFLSRSMSTAPLPPHPPFPASPLFFLLTEPSHSRPPPSTAPAMSPPVRILRPLPCFLLHFIFFDNHRKLSSQRSLLRLLHRLLPSSCAPFLQAPLQSSSSPLSPARPFSHGHLSFFAAPRLQRLPTGNFKQLQLKQFRRRLISC